MFWKRQVPIFIVALIGSITLFGWFIDQPDVKEFIGDDATQSYDKNRNLPFPKHNLKLPYR